MVRHYCDWCDSETKPEQLSAVQLETIDEAHHKYNRSDANRWYAGIKSCVCLACRLAVLNTIKERKELAAKPKN